MLRSRPRKTSPSDRGLFLIWEISLFLRVWTWVSCASGDARLVLPRRTRDSWGSGVGLRLEDGKAFWGFEICVCQWSRAVDIMGEVLAYNWLSFWALVGDGCFWTFTDAPIGLYWSLMLSVIDGDRVWLNNEEKVSLIAHKNAWNQMAGIEKRGQDMTKERSIGSPWIDQPDWWHRIEANSPPSLRPSFLLYSTKAPMM